MPAHSRLLLSGYYGFGNTGDEAILAGALAGFRELAPQVEIVVLSQDPQATTAQHGVPAIPRGFRSLKQALAQCDLFVSGGGGLIQDATSWRSPLYYLQAVRMALGRRVPVMLMAQSITPLRRHWVRWLARRVLNRVSLITVRDAASARELSALGVARPQVVVTADLSLLLSSPPVSASSAAQRVIVCPRRWPGASESACHALVHELAGGLSQVAAEVVLLPMQPRDLAVTRAVAAAMSRPAQVVEPARSFEELLALIGSAQVAVGMRLHALIFAARLGAVPLGISYDPKVCAFLETIGELPIATPEQVRAGALAERIARAFAEHAEKRAQLLAVMEQPREAARENIRLAVELVKKQEENLLPSKQRGFG